MKLDKEIVIESTELQLLLTEGDTEGAMEKGESLLSKMKKSLSEKIKALKSIFSKKSKDIVQAKNADGTITTKLVNPKYLDAFNKAYTQMLRHSRKYLPLNHSMMNIKTFLVMHANYSINFLTSK